LRKGEFGEKAAVDYLLRKSFRILAKNYRLRFGEIDIIAKKGKTLIFCEVKTRESSRFGEPFEAVTEAKRERLKKLAEGYLLAEKPDFEEIRFDVISIFIDKEKSIFVNHLEGAFD
jgi:putative endonuclease